MAADYNQRIRVYDTGVVLRQNVKMKANHVVEVGNLIVTVSGYSAFPATANAATGKIAGVSLDAADNTGGADGAQTITAEDGTYDFKNDGTHPCAQADVGSTVYASAKDTISNTSSDGPPVGKLVEFAPSDQAPSRPCRVRLDVVGG